MIDDEHNNANDDNDIPDIEDEPDFYDELANSLKELMSSLKNIDNKIISVDARLNNLEQRVETVEQRVEHIKDEGKREREENLRGWISTADDLNRLKKEVKNDVVKQLDQFKDTLKKAAARQELIDPYDFVAQGFNVSEATKPEQRAFQLFKHLVKLESHKGNKVVKTSDAKDILGVDRKSAKRAFDALIRLCEKKVFTLEVVRDKKDNEWRVFLND